MISRITFCSAQPLRIRRERLGPMPVNLLETLGCLLDGVEHGRPKGLHQLAGVDRADAPDHAGAEIALDAFQRGRRGRLEEGGLELQPMGSGRSARCPTPG